MQQPPIVHIILKTGSDPEQEAKSRLLSFFERYPLLSHWCWTSLVLVEEGAIPHSHPELTLGTAYRDHPHLYLSIYLHEQLHWFLAVRPTLGQAIEALQRIYPTLPVGHPLGCRSLYSSYLHILLCTLKYDCLCQLLRSEEATAVFRHWKQDHYREIYERVLRDHPQLHDFLVHHDLHLETPPA